MKKMFEITIKSNHEIDYNSEEFDRIKENVKETIIQKLGTEAFKRISYQCNCNKLYNAKKNEYLLFIKVYGWHKIKSNEHNFYINTETSTQKQIATLKEKTALLKKLKKEISQLRYKLAVTYLDITDTISEDPESAETFDIVDKLNEKVEILRNEIDEKVKQHDFINLEIMIGDIR